MISIHKDNLSSMVVVYKDEGGYMCLNIPKSKELVQLSFTDLNMCKNVESFNRIPIFDYTKSEFASNNTHIKEAESYLQAYIVNKDDAKLINFMTDFYKSIVEYDASL